DRQRLTLGGIGLRTHAAQGRFQLRIGISAVVCRSAFGERLIEYVKRVTSNQHIGGVHRDVEVLALRQRIADIVHLLDLNVIAERLELSLDGDCHWSPLRTCGGAEQLEAETLSFLCPNAICTWRPT